MSLNLNEIVGNIFYTDKKEQEEEEKKASELQEKTGALLGTTDKPATKQYNPFVKENGELFNPYLDYQKILDNSNVSQVAKRYIAQATGLTPTVTPVQTSTSSNNGFSSTIDDIGFISAKYESGGNGGTISNDTGGLSYGISQFNTGSGSAANFVSWLKKTNPEMASAFGNYQAGTSNFSNAWTQTYSKYGEAFTKLQKKFTYEHFVMPLVNLAKQKTGIDYTRSTALLELVYSTAVQFGAGNLGLSALGNVNSGMSDTDIINASYDKKIANYKSFFSSSSSAVQEGVRKRFQSERNDVLALVGKGKSPKISGTGKYSSLVGTKVAKTDTYKNDAAYGQCVWYVRGRMKEKFGKDWGAIGNANQVWYNVPSQARLQPTADNIKPDTVASYKIGSSGSQYGHVIYIEDVVGDTVYFTEGGSGYHRSGNDGVVKKTTKQNLLNGTGGYGSGLIGLVDINKI